MTCRVVSGAVFVLVLAASACSDSSHKAATTAVPSPRRSATSTIAASTTTTVGVAPDPNVAFVAQAKVPRVRIYARPGAANPILTVDNPWRTQASRPDTAVPQVFLTDTRRDDGWVRVLLPIRPNGSVGWIRATDVSVSPVVYRLTVALAAHRITVYDHGTVQYSGKIADGALSTPTPPGRYYIRVLIKAPNPNTVYGPYAYGLSSHSDTLNMFDGSDAEIGIHGNDNPAVLGTSVTHGCIRIDNKEISTLATLLPLGTPVDIQP